MEKKIIKVLLVVVVIASSFLVGLNVSGGSNEKTFTLNDMAYRLVVDENIIVKDKDYNILFKGEVDNIPNKLKGEKVKEYGSCDDDDFTTTFILGE